MPTIAELETELGLAAGTLTGNPEVAAKWNGYLSDGATAKQEAERKLAEAQSLQRAVDENIAQFGMTEANVAQLRASNAAYAAALEEVKKAGFNGINIPNLPTNTLPTKSADEQFRENVMRGFTQVGQTMAVQNRYFAVFGKPMPDDPMKFGDEAAAARMSISDYANHKYGFAAEEARQREAAQKAHDENISAAAVAKYKEDHPSTAGNPELNGGMPSRYPQLPPQREAKDLRQFSSLSTRDKIAQALTRSRDFAATQQKTV